MTREVALSHPGEILLKDWLVPLGISQYTLAKAIGVPHRRINEIVQGHRGISADTAARLGAFFGVDAEGWLALQAHYDYHPPHPVAADGATFRPIPPGSMPAFEHNGSTACYTASIGST